MLIKSRPHRPYHTPALFEGSTATEETDEDWADGYDENEDGGAVVNVNRVVRLEREREIVFSILDSLHRSTCSSRSTKDDLSTRIHIPRPRPTQERILQLGKWGRYELEDLEDILTNTKKLEANNNHLLQPLKKPIARLSFFLNHRFLQRENYQDIDQRI